MRIKRRCFSGLLTFYLCSIRANIPNGAQRRSGIHLQKGNGCSNRLRLLFSQRAHRGESRFVGRLFRFLCLSPTKLLLSATGFTLLFSWQVQGRFLDYRFLPPGATRLFLTHFIRGYAELDFQPGRQKPMYL